ncbi:MAG TPA: TRAP transporter TatT component family protein, partial [Vicinamibacterales bacterium]
WGADIALSSSPSQLTRIPELAPVRALLMRAKALDPAWDRGAIYEAMIAFDGLPPLLGGSAAAARADFDKAMELSDGKSVFARVTYALTLSNETERHRLLQEAAQVDVTTVPAHRLTNLIAQRYARALLTAAR